MRREYDVVLEGDSVVIVRDGVAIGRARWTGWRLVDRSVLSDEVAADEPEIYAVLEQRLAAQAAGELEALAAAAYDADGIDRSLIRWMLGLSPRERLRVLDEHNRSMARLRGVDDR